MDRGAWWATVLAAATSQTQLRDFHFQGNTETKPVSVLLKKLNLCVLGIFVVVK